MPDYAEELDYLDCRRGEFPANSRIIDDQEFLDQLAALDEDAEVLWNPRRNVWSLYRVTHYGASPADDQLEHEFDLQHPPGFWLIEYMRSRQLIVPGTGPQSLPKAKQAWLTRVKDMIGRRRAEQDRKWADFMHDIKGNLHTYARKMRRSDVGTRYPQRQRPAALRDGAARVFIPARPVNAVDGTVHNEAESAASSLVLP